MAEPVVETLPEALQLKIVSLILDDVRAGVISGGCICSIHNCPGPASHWIPRALIPKGQPKADRNEIRRTDNLSRLVTLIYAVSVFRRLGYDEEATELEAWTRPRWHCGELPGAEVDREAWARAHLRRLNPPERA